MKQTIKVAETNSIKLRKLLRKSSIVRNSIALKEILNSFGS